MARRGENIYKRKDGRWEGRYKTGFNVNGHAKYRSVYGKSYLEVKEKLSRLKAEPENFISSGRLTVKELFEEWLSSVQFRVKASTLANYRMKADKHILPEFGGVRYENLTARTIYKFIQNKINSGLSSKYVADIVILFKSMAKYTAREHGFCNPLEMSVCQKMKRKRCIFFGFRTENTLSSYE